jgi:hypothetical protein
MPFGCWHPLPAGPFASLLGQVRLRVPREPQSPSAGPALTAAFGIPLAASAVNAAVDIVPLPAELNLPGKRLASNAVWVDTTLCQICHIGRAAAPSLVQDMQRQEAASLHGNRVP